MLKNPEPHVDRCENCHRDFNDKYGWNWYNRMTHLKSCIKKNPKTSNEAFKTESKIENEDDLIEKQAKRICMEIDIKKEINSLDCDQKAELKSNEPHSCDDFEHLKSAANSSDCNNNEFTTVLSAEGASIFAQLAEECVSKDKIKCKICSKYMSVSKMRSHISQHMLLGEAAIEEDSCGYCGERGCSIGLEPVSSNKKRLRPVSNCVYYKDFRLKTSENVVESNPSSNRPVECALCKKANSAKTVYWTYNIGQHYNEKHRGEIMPIYLTLREILFLISDKKY